MNVLWQGLQLSGVVDWVNASVGPPGIDAGWCRQNLAQSHGVVAPERFRLAYEASSGARQDPRMDALALVEVLAAPSALEQLHDAGLGGLTEGMRRARLDEYAALVAART